MEIEALQPWTSRGVRLSRLACPCPSLAPSLRQDHRPEHRTAVSPVPAPPQTCLRDGETFACCVAIRGTVLVHPCVHCYARRNHCRPAGWETSGPRSRCVRSRCRCSILISCHHTQPPPPCRSPKQDIYIGVQYMGRRERHRRRHTTDPRAHLRRPPNRLLEPRRSSTPSRHGLCRAAYVGRSAARELD